MKRISSVFAFLFVFISAYSAPAAESIVGSYTLEMGKPGNSLEVILECKEETKCTFTSISKSDKSPFKDVQLLNNVYPVENLIYATNALKYAINHQTQSSGFPDAIESMSRLRPVLSTNPRISKCWDLNYPNPGYMLACTLSGTPVDSPPIYLFATLMTNCNDVFCRYLITPMSRIK